MLQKFAEPAPIAAAHGRNREYLMIGFDRSNRVKVTPTQLGKRALDGRLWPVWLRAMLLNTANPKFAYGVEIDGKHVYVSSSGDPKELFSTVFSLAARIRPLNNLLDVVEEDTSPTLVIWNIRQGRRYYPIDMLIEHITLPSKASLTVTPSSYNSPDQLRLHRERSCTWSIHDLKAWIELRLALLIEEGSNS